MVCKRTPLLALLVAAMAFTSSAAWADDYADVDKLFGAGQFGEAVQKADQFLAANPRDARMRFLKGLVLSEQGRSSDAIAVFVKMTEDFPELPEPHNNLAVLYSKQGQYDQARRSLESAIRTNPSYATAYENLGDVYAKLASQAYSKALQIDGGNATKVAPKLSMIRDLFSPRATTLASTSVKPTPVAPTTPTTPTTPATPLAAKTVATVVAAAAAKPAAVAPASAKPAASSADAQETLSAALAWASAWSRKDMEAYFAAYTPDFGAGKSRKAWEEERRARITGKNRISVVLTDIQTRPQGDKAIVQFRQSYTADALKVSSRKTLEMVRVSGRWLIQKESTGS